MPSDRSSSRGRSRARKDIIQMLVDDHKRARKAFRAFEKLDPAQDAEACQALVQRTCGELQVHAALEEELFYPAARSALKNADLVEEAEIEHMSAKQLIEQVQTMTPAEPKFAAAFKVLGEYVKHHVKEEENEMFPALERARIEWERLLEEMTARRAELMEQFLPEIVGDARAITEGIHANPGIPRDRDALAAPVRSTAAEGGANATSSPAGPGTSFSDDADVH